MTSKLTVDYYFAPQSPWTYLGHARFERVAREAGAALRVMPIDLGGRVFPVTGGLPLAKRAPQRQAYRLLELQRFADWLAVPIHLEPRFFPVRGDDAARLIIATDMHDGTAAAMRLSGAILSACWAEELNIADEPTLAGLLERCGIPRSRLEDGQRQDVAELYETYTERALAAGVFGAPSYVVEGEIFWGQDRLDFLERRLARG
jgi:2-hydroxychromene-2-carboxylate isomerase